MASSSDLGDPLMSSLIDGEAVLRRFLPIELAT